MNAETLRGVLLIIGIGLAVLVVAAIVDWRSARRARDVLASPPGELPGDHSDDTDDSGHASANETSGTPQLGTPQPGTGHTGTGHTGQTDTGQTDTGQTDTGQTGDTDPAAVSTTSAAVRRSTPTYVPAPEAHTRPPRRLLDDDEAAALNQPGAIELTGHLVDPHLATHRKPEALVVQGARVLCCPEGIGSPREVMQTLERSARDRTPVIVAAPAIDPEVVDLLLVNTARGNLTGGAVVLGAGDCLALAESLGGYGVTRADLQSGYVPHSAYGTAAWVAVDDDRARFWPTH